MWLTLLIDGGREAGRGAQSADQLQKLVAAGHEIGPRAQGLLHRDRNPDLRREADETTAPAFGHDADDGEGVVVEMDRVTDDVGITGEPGLPRAVTEHRQGRLAADVRLLGPHRSSPRRLDAQDLEVVGGHELNRDLGGFAPLAQPESRDGGGGQAPKHPIALDEVQVVGR